MQENVPFEGTNLSIIARSWTRGSARVSGEEFRENERIFRETETFAQLAFFFFFFFLSEQRREITLFYVEPLLRFLPLDFDREECTTTTISFVSVTMTVSRIVVRIDE